MSLGGLIVGEQPVSAAIVAATTSASCEVSCGESRSVIAGRSKTENQSPRYGADSQRRPYCPRPFVWRSAKTTKPAAAPRSAAAQARSFVDGVSSTTTISFPIPDPASSARSSVAIKRSLGSDMRQFQRQIDGARRMSQRADGNVIDPGRRDPPDILQGDAAARLEFHFPFSCGHGFAHFRRLHVVEQDDVDAVDLEKGTDLFKPVRFHLDAKAGPFLPQPLDRVYESGETGAGVQMVVLHQDHFTQG